MNTSDKKREYMIAYRNDPTNKEKARLRAAAWRAADPDRARATESASRLRHKAHRQKYNQEYREVNRERLKTRDALRYEMHCARIQSIPELKEEQARKVRPIRREYMRKRRKEDVGFRLSLNLRDRVSKAVKASGGRKAALTERLVGCSAVALRQHLESKFTSGMTWNNYGFRGWHIDHIIPCSAFDLRDPKQQNLCFHYTNLQPLWAVDNQRKGKKALCEPIA